MSLDSTPVIVDGPTSPHPPARLRSCGQQSDSRVSARRQPRRSTANLAAGTSPRLVEELEAGVAAIEQAATQASCETRLLVGQQAAAFTAAALPLCRRV